MQQRGETAVAVRHFGAAATTVLVYSYAAGVFGSCDIAILASRDSTLHYLCWSSLPDCDTIRLFRRQHVQLVKRCLESLLETVWESLKANGFTLAMSDLASPGSWPDRWRALNCNPDFAAEAENRVKRAIHADSMAMDD
jgi:hypothetical protein